MSSTLPPVPPTSEAPTSKPKSHVLGKIALGAAVVGFIFACVPGALIVGWILLPIAFILSLVAMFKEGGKGPAITALILSIVGTIVGFIVFLAVVADAFDDAVDDADKDTTSEEVKQSSDDDGEAVEAAADETGGDYTVTIDGVRQAKDYQGAPALVVDYTFTNNSDDTTSFLMAITATAFQDGVELETAIFMDDTSEAMNAMKDIKPGKSIKVQEGFVLDGKEDVELEVEESFSLDDTLLATKTVSIK